MPTSTALTIWIASGQLSLPITDAIVNAATEILGPGVTVQAQAYPDGQPEAARPPTEGERSVQLSWTSPRFEGAHLVLCRAPQDCFERSVTFRPDDPELERGRTVGFLATAVFLENGPHAPAPRPSSAPRPAPPAPEVGAPKPSRGSVSAAATLAVPGDGTSVGARLDADYAVAEPFRLGAGVEARLGEVSAAQATSRIMSAGLTLGLRVAQPTRALWIAVELGVGAYQLSISHLSSDDPAADRKNRWLFGGDLTGKLALNINELSSVFLAPGVEVLSGKTDIVVDGRVVATWPVAMPIARLGFRAAF